MDAPILITVPMQTCLKRILDLALASLLLVAAAPVMAAVAAGVWLVMGRPVLFRQLRAGQGGRPFMLWKFRTMRDAFAPDGQPLDDAERLTSFGRLLRKTSLDELPQLLHVLRGQMSLVGPRPLPIRYLDRYTAEQARRHDVRPGLTGWAQVNGRNALSWPQKFALDVWYVEHWSLALDATVLVRTALKLVHPDGISHGQEATMPEFRGGSRQNMHHEGHEEHEGEMLEGCGL